MASFCSPSCDRSLTKRLIQISNSPPSKSSYRFANTLQWVDGIDIWSTPNIIEKSNYSQFNGDFHQDIGLYLPRHEKASSAPISSKNGKVSFKISPNNNLFPERLKQLLKKEKILLLENAPTISSSDDQLSSSEKKRSSRDPSNSVPQSNCHEAKSSKLRLPLRQVASNNCLQEIKSKERDQENLTTLLKQHLTSLFTQGSRIAAVNPKRTLIRIPSVEIKHQNIPQKSFPPPTIDPSLIMERYEKLRQLLISSPPSTPSINKKLIDCRQSPLVFQGISSFGLSVTPIEFSPLKSSSLEKIIEQENNLSTNRPSSQSASFSSPIHSQNEQIKRHFENGFISSSGDFVLSNTNSIGEQTQNIRKYHRHHRSSSTSHFQRSKTLQLLPPVVSGKRLHMPISTQRHS